MRFRSQQKTKLGCIAVTRVLQAYLDGEVDELTARQVCAHLDHCRRCGMGADTYRAIKAAIARNGPGWDDETRRRLADFARRVAQREPDAGDL